MRMLNTEIRTIHKSDLKKIDDLLVDLSFGKKDQKQISRVSDFLRQLIKE